MKTEEKYRHFRELTLNLHRAGFTVGGETPDSLLPVELDGRRLCCVTEKGGVRYRDEDAGGEARREALERVIDIAMTTAEYMRQMEAAPFLKADGLEEGYRLLAEFNGTALAGQQTRYGVQFITWARTYDGSGVTQGHYHGFSGTEGYTAARQDFAVRSGLVLRERVFSDKQLAAIFDAAQHMETLGLSSNPEQSRLLEEAMEQIESAVPEVIDIANELTQQPAAGGMTFC